MMAGQRKTLRLQGYDYSEPGGYFITIAVQGHAYRFGEVKDGEMALSAAGKIVERAWQDLPNHYPNVVLDDYAVMPDHFHGILILTDVSGDGLTETIRAFKSFSARRINLMDGTTGKPVWQRSYFDRILRGERELDAARQYIRANPLRWKADP